MLASGAPLGVVTPPPVFETEAPKLILSGACALHEGRLARSH